MFSSLSYKTKKAISHVRLIASFVLPKIGDTLEDDFNF